MWLTDFTLSRTGAILEKYHKDTLKKYIQNTILHNI
jgi:hypothetical protein